MKQFKLAIELVPRSLWRINLRSEMGRTQWDKLRKGVYAEYKYQCGICGISNVTLHCHERWAYGDQEHVQKLEGFIALCELCHHVKHIGHAGILASEGKLNLDIVNEHFMKVNDCSREEYEEHRIEAFSQWRERNNYSWICDVGSFASLLPTNTRFIDGKFHGAKA